MEYSSTSSSESDSTLFQKLYKGEKRQRKYKRATLKRNPREGMCLLSGDEKSSNEEKNLVDIQTDSNFESIPLDILSTTRPNLISLDDGEEELEKSMVEINTNSLKSNSSKFKNNEK